MRRRFDHLAIAEPRDLVFGVSPHPVTTRSGLTVGGGLVYPEINFTLPPMVVTQATMGEVENQYRAMVKGCLARAVDLEVPGVVVEFEALPPMTENPDWGMAVVRILLDALEDSRTKHGLVCALRMTPNDTREMTRPPRMRSGALYDAMMELFERSAEAGADFLSIESVGGKEVHDDALMACDLRWAVFSLCVMGARDMSFLWSKIVECAEAHGAIAAGDTACGFGNTAMVLAEQKMIPRVFAAVIRAVSAVRSLVAYSEGALGPGKDCGYENIILKAITGMPMAMEGRSSAGAHLSRVGNVAGAACDLWSNESIHNVKLLSAMAPTVGMEQIAYDCRLFNEASNEGAESALALQRWHVESDSRLDPQAYVLRPDSAVEIARAIVGCDSAVSAGKAAAQTAINLLKDAHAEGRLSLEPRELTWLGTLDSIADDLPDSEEDLTTEVMQEVDREKFCSEDYLLA
jgi:methanol---5-hydroxybenzimidazolylcobamide Co-methyltransferase